LQLYFIVFAITGSTSAWFPNQFVYGWESLRRILKLVCSYSVIDYFPSISGVMFVLIGTVLANLNSLGFEKKNAENMVWGLFKENNNCLTYSF
jgi:hypothetical protein